MRSASRMVSRSLSTVRQNRSRTYSNSSWLGGPSPAGRCQVARSSPSVVSLSYLGTRVRHPDSSSVTSTCRRFLGTMARRGGQQQRVVVRNPYGH